MTELLSPDLDGLARAATLLREGGLVAFPTETVYGLGADAGDDRAVARIYAAKGRPRFNPLIVHVPDPEAAAALTLLEGDALRLARAFWPGPLTLVLPLRSGAPLSPLLRAGLPSVAVRVPGAALARELLRQTGRPVAAPSANRSGRISPTLATHVLESLGGRIDAVLDGGPATVGVESTIVGFTDDQPRLLRPGGLPQEALEAALGRPLAARADDAITAPGQLGSHYAPQAALRLDVLKPEPGELLIGFGPVKGEVTLSASGDLVEAAARLFRLLHELDGPGRRLAVAPIPDHGLGRAIRDRLARAAAPKDPRQG